MAKFCPLFSSSKGNCVFVSSEKGSLLIDAGVSCAAIVKALENAGSNIKDIGAILITHEHSDHIKGLSVLVKKYNIPVAASKRTLDAIINMGVVDDAVTLIALEKKPTEIAGFTVNRFSVSHDSCDPSGYRINLNDDLSIAVCTDLGFITDEVKEHLTGCRLVMLESNHDIKMLESGPYPPELKLRISGKKGHLSNSACASEVARLYKTGTNRFVLGHLSENNNLPMLAKSISEAALMDLGAVNGKDYILCCAMPKDNGIIYL